MTATLQYWKKCSSCKKEIGLNSSYFECSVSTCNGLRTGYVFCSVSCWERHLPGARHRDAGAIEKRSPKTPAQENVEPLAKEVGTSSSSSMASAGPVRRIISNPTSTHSTSAFAKRSPMENEVLVVVSKTKQYIRDLSEYNTSDEVNQTLSDIIREACREAIDNARADGRKTVMSRDFKKSQK